MQTKLLELRPNRSLLNSDFDGYKLSLAAVQTVTEQLKVPVDRLVPDINQYSLLHAKLYALHNHLIGEGEGENDSVYFIDKELNVQKFSVDSELNQFSTATLWQIPMRKERISGDYNVSMKFTLEKLAVIADGIGCLYVLDRGNIQSDDTWRVIFSGDVAGPDENFIISDALYKEAEKPELHLLLLSIRQKGANERHATILHWITLQKTDTWNQIALRELTVRGFVQYANFERTCGAIYVVSDSGCRFTLDSEKEIREAPESAPEKKYTWTQTRDDVTVKFQLPRGATKNLVEVKVENTQIQVVYEQGVLLDGPLYQRVDAEMSTWSVGNNVLEVVVQKSETGLMWPEFVQGDVHGEHVPDQALVDEIAERLAPLTSETEATPPSGTTFNSQQVEECDFECDKLTVLERLCCDSHNITHKVNLGSHQVLLTVDMDKTLPQALGVRSDVDTCIWQPKIESDNFCVEHVGTLLAMGYIQASKQQMKFFVCSPDLSYSAICESNRHIFIYCQNKQLPSSNELRNRTTGKRISTLAQQQVINLPSSDEILGIYASNSYLYVLGETFITAFKL